MAVKPSLLTTDARWWLPEFRDTRAQKIQTVAGRLWQDASAQRTNLHTAERLYGDMPLLGLTPSTYRRRQRVSWNRLSLNATKSVIDTFVALVTKDQPKLSVLTNKYDWGLQQKAKLLESFYDGTFFETGFQGLTTLLEFDTCIAGTGWAYYFVNDSDPDDLRIGVERVTDDEILVDEDASMYGKPPYMLRIKWVDRLELMSRYPDEAQRLEMANNSQFGSDFERSRHDNQMSDQVICIQAWKPAEGGEDGVYCYCAGDVVLDEQPWPYEDYPLEPLYVEQPRKGIRGQSTAEQMMGIQREINVLALKIQRYHHLLAAGHWFVEEGSNIVTAHMDNMIGSIVKYRGTPPQPFAGMSVPSDVYAHLDRLYQRAFELRGISPMAAMGAVPQGLDQASGKALLVHADLTTQRFQPSYRLFQDFHLRAGRQFERLAVEISERQPSFAVKAIGPSMMRAVKWAEARLEDSEYAVRIYPTNALASDFEGKLAQVEQMANAGWVQPADAMRLLDFPDLTAFGEEQNASRDAIMACFDSIMTDGVYKAPEPLMDLADAIKRFQNGYLIMWRKNAPQDRLQLLLRWIAQAKSQIPTPPAPPTLPPGPPSPSPGGPPPPQQALALPAGLSH